MVVHATTASGGAVDFVVHQAFHSILLELLDRANDAARSAEGADRAVGARAVAPIRVAPRWAAVLAALAAAWLAFWLWAFVAGTVVRAEVLRSADELCVVRWTAPDGPERAEVDCDYSTRPGDTLEVLAMPWPFRGEAVTPGITQGIAGVVAFALIAPAGVTAMLRMRRRRKPTPESPESPAPHADATAIPVLEPSEFSFETAAQTMERRAQAERWPAVVPAHDGVTSPIPRAWWRVGPLRRTAIGAFATASIPLVFTLPAVLFGAGWWITSVSMSFGDVARAEATVVEVIPAEYPFQPDDARVRFQVGSRTIHASVAARRSLVVGEDETISYDVEHPQRARLVSGDGTRSGAIVTVLIATLTAGMAWARIGRVRRALHGVLDVARQPGTEMRYVLFVDADGTVNALLFGDRPFRHELFGLPLAADVRGSVPVSGQAVVRGQVPDDIGTLVPEANGVVLWPAGYAVRTTPEEVTPLLNAHFFDDEAAEGGPIA